MSTIDFGHSMAHSKLSKNASGFNTKLKRAITNNSAQIRINSPDKSSKDSTMMKDFLHSGTVNLRAPNKKNDEGISNKSQQNLRQSYQISVHS